MSQISMLENILAKIVEVDRLILRRTEPDTSDAPGVTGNRRKSRGCFRHHSALSISSFLQNYSIPFQINLSN
jgi:hypothetical protein